MPCDCPVCKLEQAVCLTLKIHQKVHPELDDNALLNILCRMLGGVAAMAPEDEAQEMIDRICEAIYEAEENVREENKPNAPARALH